MASTFQFSVRHLLIAVAFSALGITALMNAGGWWVSALWIVVILLLAAAVLLCVYRRDESRAFWLGFLVFGWTYFGVVLYAYMPSGASARTDPVYSEYLLTTRLIYWANSMMIPQSRREQMIPDPAGQGTATPGMPGMGGMPPGAGGGMTPMGMAGGTSGPPPGGMMGGGFGSGMPGMGVAMIPNPDFVDPTCFMQIGHALWLVVLAALGGKLGQWIYRTGVRNQEPSARNQRSGVAES